MSTDVLFGSGTLPNYLFQFGQLSPEKWLRKGRSFWTLPWQVTVRLPRSHMYPGIPFAHAQDVALYCCN